LTRPRATLKETIRHLLKKSFSESELEQWFEPLDITGRGNGEKHVEIIFPHPYFAQWFATNVQSSFEEHLGRGLGQGCVITYVQRQPAARKAEPLAQRTARIDFPFGADFTFDSFITNSKNYFPVASAKEVAGQVNMQYNPFIVCGKQGSGKTHLVKAIANEMSKQVDKERIFFGTVEDIERVFAVQFNNNHSTAKRSFHDYRCLIVDDVHLFKDYPHLQEHFTSIFNYFHENRRQLVFSCVNKINSYLFLIPELKSRMGWGLSVTLKEPDLDVRIKYIQSECRNRHIHLNKDQVLTLAQRFKDLRYLQGILLKLSAFKSLMHKDIASKDFKQILSHAEELPSKTLEPKQIIDVVAEHFQLHHRDLVGNKRHHGVVYARQMAMYLCRELVGCSYPRLGELFGGKDHSTAMYAIKKVKKLIKDNPDVQKMLTGLKKKCSYPDES